MFKILYQMFGLEPGRDDLPLYSGKAKAIQEVGQKQYATTSADNREYVLGTMHIGPCVAFAGYDSRRRIGFLAHYDHSTYMKESLDLLVRDLVDASSGTPEFDCRLVGGWGRKENPMVTAIRNYFCANDELGLKIRITYEDIGGFPRQRSLALDTTTGIWYSYSLTCKPYEHRDLKASSRRSRSHGVAERVLKAKNQNVLKKKGR